MKQMCKILIECTVTVPCYISFDTFKTFFFSDEYGVRKKTKTKKRLGECGIK